MSLEAAINDTNTLLRELIARLPGVAPAAAPAKPTPTGGRVSSADPKPAASNSPPAPAATPTPASPAPVGSSAPSSNVPPYTEVQKAITTLVAQPGGRAKAEAILASFEHKDKPGAKATNGKELKPSDWLGVIEACAKAGAAA